MSSLTGPRFPRQRGEQTRSKILAALHRRLQAGEGAPVIDELATETGIKTRTLYEQLDLMTEAGVVRFDQGTREVVRRVVVLVDPQS